MRKTTNNVKKNVTTNKKAVKTAKTPIKATKSVKSTKTTKTAVKGKEKANKKPVSKETNKFYENSKEFIARYGFDTVSMFAKALKHDIANTTKVLQGVQKPNIEKMIQYSITLNCSLGEVINLFYPDEMKQYKKSMDKRKNGKKK